MDVNVLPSINKGSLLYFTLYRHLGILRCVLCKAYDVTNHVQSHICSKTCPKTAFDNKITSCLE